MSTVERPPAPPYASSRTFRKAAKDLVDGGKQRQLWAHLGWQDIKQRYRRSVIGPLWITISMGMMVTALGILYSQLLDSPIETKLPYIAVGFIVWNFIQGCVVEGAEVFIINEGLMKQLPAPLSVHILRLVWRQVLFFAHNMVIYVIVYAIFHNDLPVGLGALTVIPALALLMVNGAWVATLFGVVSTRFRDIPPVMQSLTTMLLFMTPIMWSVEDITNRPGSEWRAGIADVNPIYHYIEIVRDPLLGKPVELYHWGIVLALTVVGWLLALFVLRNYRARVPYWV